MKIGAYDDEEIYQNEVKDLLVKYTIQRDIAEDFHLFTSAQELLTQAYRYNILLLDVVLEDNYNGIEIAKELRENDYTGEIIFITSTGWENVNKSICYPVQCSGFLNKPVVCDELFSALDSIHNKHLDQKHSRLEIAADKIKQFIRIGEIIYITNTDKLQTIYTKNQTYHVRESIRKQSTK